MVVVLLPQAALALHFASSRGLEGAELAQVIASVVAIEREGRELCVCVCVYIYI